MVVSRIESHAEDKLSALERFAAAQGRKLTVRPSVGYVDRVAEAKADYKHRRKNGKFPFCKKWYAKGDREQKYRT